MKVGIIGYEGVGKTTIFSALAGIDPAEAQQSKLREIKVPDDRIDRLSAMYMPQKTIYATIQFEDVMAQGGASAKALDASAVAKIREADLLAIVVRGYDSAYFATAANPLREARNMLNEMLLSDMEVVERKVSRMQKERISEQEKALFLKMSSCLESEKWLSTLELDKNEQDLIVGYRFLTLKPVVIVVNVSEELADESRSRELCDTLASELSLPIFPLSAKVESDIALLPEEDQPEFLADLGIKATARSRFVRTAYEMLDLISFFTVGEDEVRAWTVRRGSNAQESAGKIHTDLAKHFIRAERMSSADLLELGSEQKVKEAGKFKLEGKNYVTQDGDILHIRANA